MQTYISCRFCLGCCILSDMSFSWKTCQAALFSRTRLVYIYWKMPPIYIHFSKNICLIYSWICTTISLYNSNSLFSLISVKTELLPWNSLAEPFSNLLHMSGSYFRILSLFIWSNSLFNWVIAGSKNSSTNQ